MGFDNPNSSAGIQRFRLPLDARYKEWCVTTLLQANLVGVVVLVEDAEQLFTLDERKPSFVLFEKLLLNGFILLTLQIEVSHISSIRECF